MKKNNLRFNLVSLLSLIATLGFISSCELNSVDEQKQESEYGRYSEVQTIYDATGDNYVSYTVYADDISALKEYLKGDFRLVPMGVNLIDDSELDEVSEEGSESTLPEMTITSVPLSLKLDYHYDEGFQVDVRPLESDLRGWNYTGNIYGPEYMKRFQVNRHTGWHRVYVASYYQDDYGNYYQEEEPFTSVPNNSASVGYNRCYSDVYKWTINIQYRKSKHYSYGWAWNCN